MNVINGNISRCFVYDWHVTLWIVVAFKSVYLYLAHCVHTVHTLPLALSACFMLVHTFRHFIFVNISIQISPIYQVCAVRPHQKFGRKCDRFDIHIPFSTKIDVSVQCTRYGTSQTASQPMYIDFALFAMGLFLSSFGDASAPNQLNCSICKYNKAFVLTRASMSIPKAKQNKKEFQRKLIAIFRFMFAADKTNIHSSLIEHTQNKTRTHVWIQTYASFYSIDGINPFLDFWM